MLWSAILVVLLGVLGVGNRQPAPSTSTTIPIPESPAAGLTLESNPPPPPPPALPGPVPMPALPYGGGAASALAAMVVGMALLARRGRRISAAELNIRRSLQDNLFSDVGHRDLTRIATIVNSLDRGEATAVIGSLSDHELGVWMRELDGWQGSFDSREEARLFADLAAKLSPEQMARVIARGKAVELMEAAAVGAPPTVRVELALLLWAGLSPLDRGWDQIVELFSAAPLEVIEAVVAGKPSGEVVAELLGVHQVERDGDIRLQLDAMARFIDVAAGFDDPALKARLFVAAVEQLVPHRRRHPIGEVTYDDTLGRLASLLRSDTAAIVTRLNHAVDPHGNTTSQWIQQMIEADRLDELDVLLAALMGGGDRLDNFTDPGRDPAHPYENAANLGYYIGAYSLAIDGIADDAEDQITLVRRLFSIVTGIVPHPGGSEVRLPIGPLVDIHAGSVVDGFREDAASLKQTLWDLAKPRTPDGLLWNGPGTTQFQDAWEEVVVVR